MNWQNMLAKDAKLLDRNHKTFHAKKKKSCPKREVNYSQTAAWFTIMKNSVQPKYLKPELKKKKLKCPKVKLEFWG